MSFLIVVVLYGLFCALCGAAFATFTNADANRRPMASETRQEPMAGREV